MTKKELRWRLKDLPSAEGIAQLVKEKVITAEEGRQLLLSEVKRDESRKIQSLEEEVKFLRKVVDTLASKTNGYTTIYHEYHDWTPNYPWWYKQYKPVIIGYNQATTQKIGDYELSSGTLGVSNMTNNLSMQSADTIDSPQAIDRSTSLLTLSSLNN